MPKAVIYNMAGEKVGEYALSEAVFGVEPNAAVLHATPSPRRPAASRSRAR